MRKALLGVVCMFTLLNVRAQYIEEYPVNEGNGDLMIEIKNWPEGIRIFGELIKKKPGNLSYRYKIGKCYTYSDLDQKKGLAHLEDLMEFDLKEDDFEETLALSYFKNYRFKEAKKLYKKLTDNAKDAEQAQRFSDMQSQCDRSENMLKNPVDVTFENLGKNINSPAPDFLPFVRPDESSIHLSTRRKGVVGNLYSYAGYRTSDAFYAKHIRNKYSKARSVGSPNTYGNEFTAGRSENGRYMAYTVNSEDNFDDIFISELGRRSYMAPKIVEIDDGNKKISEHGATLSNDGKRLYFSSNRPGGYGGYDLYYIQRLPIGGWSEPFNLGKSVNTEKDEKYPMLMDEGTTLYFSSNGHLGMGGMDIYKSKGDLATWGKPKNLGYPINSTSDDLNISFAANQKYAYMAKSLDDSFGDLDIYRLTFGDKKDKYTLLSGLVTNLDSVPISKVVEINIFEEENGLMVGTYKSKKGSGKYSAILPPGKYEVEVIDVSGYAEYRKTITILSKNDQKAVKNFDIQLKEE